MEAACRTRIDLLLLGGDLIDVPAELPALSNLIASLAQIAPTFAVGGNHDRRVGLERVRDAVVTGGGQWLDDSTVHVAHHSRIIGLAGPAATSLPGGDVQILCGHHPRIWPAACRAGYDLVLAGHLHGCQVVAFEWRGRLFPGACFYPHCRLRQQNASSRLVVSRGVSDLVPIRWRCPREVVLCHV